MTSQRLAFKESTINPGGRSSGPGPGSCLVRVGRVGSDVRRSTHRLCVNSAEGSVKSKNHNRLGLLSVQFKHEELYNSKSAENKNSNSSLQPIGFITSIETQLEEKEKQQQQTSFTAYRPNVYTDTNFSSAFLSSCWRQKAAVPLDEPEGTC